MNWFTMIEKSDILKQREHEMLNVEQVEAKVFSNEESCIGIQSLCRLITVSLSGSFKGAGEVQFLEVDSVSHADEVLSHAKKLLIQLLSGRHSSDVAMWIANAVTYTAMRIEEARRNG